MKCIICNTLCMPVFEAKDIWCQTCVARESLRNMRDDAKGSPVDRIGGLQLSRPTQGRSRPPRYMLPRDEWVSFGYDEWQDPDCTPEEVAAAVADLRKWIA